MVRFPVRSSFRLVLACLAPLALAFSLGGCVDGDVLIPTSNGDLGGGGTDDMNVTAFDMGPGCGLNTCAKMGASCGPIGDGCGGVLDCGKCPVPQTCGGGGTPFQCGGTAACVPLKCGQLGLSCGPAGDGCGGMLDCGGCPMGQMCGGAGVNGQCGVPAAQADLAGGLCVPKGCGAANCGQMGDGCGNLITCGPMAGNCPANQSCGGGGVPFQCGAPACVPKTCAQLGVTCGPAGDGCGGLAKDAMGNTNCGTCATGSCGGGGVPGQCGSSACVPKTCAQVGATCGQASDGCGGIAKDAMGTANCGTCSSGVCGGAGVANQCGAPTCTPKTCQQQGFTCGQGSDGCGGLAVNSATGMMDCGSCATGLKCGALQPNQCGNNITGSGQCDGGQTTIEGWVVAPTDCSLGYCGTNQTAGDPIYNAKVFVPSGAITAMPVGVPACDTCSAQIPALAQATTDITGHFVLTNPPTGPGVKVVIQLGRWRRVLTLNVAPCQTNLLTYAQTHLPRIQGGNPGALDPMDNIPRFAISTGYIDVMECVLRKMGIADSEFVNPAINGSGIPQATGRVQIYQQLTLNKNTSPKGPGPGTGGAGGAIIDNNTPSDTSLWGNQNTINAYDAVLFPCTGGQDDKPSAAQNVVTSYANNGGRMFATHFSYVWTYNTYNNTTAQVPWGCGAQCTTANHTVAAWDPDVQFGTQTSIIDAALAGLGIPLSSWLQYCPDPTNALNNMAYPNTVPPQVCAPNPATPGQISVDNVRWDVDNTMAGSQQWLSTTIANPNPPPNNMSIPIHMTFNTPVFNANQCGRVVYSDFHVEQPAASAQNVTFPTECGSPSQMTPQEKLLEYMLFDLTSCVQSQTPSCTAKTCSQLGATCGLQGDGCGGIAKNAMGTTTGCGTCGAGQVCTNGTCTGGCVPKTCQQLGAVCGQQGDGCGGVAVNTTNGTMSCGTCPGGQSCVNGQCVPTSCMPLTCASQNIKCGPAGNGCGGTPTDATGTPPSCGSCPTPQTCGGGGIPGQCGGGCTPLTCAQLGLKCGPAGDGCGGMINPGGTPPGCGGCPSGQTCGGGGVPGQCGAPPDGGVMCQPLTCAAQGLSCGAAGDGCGNLLDCGPCPPGQTCGGGGTPGKCGAVNCTPTTCMAQNANCGVIGDGCGGQINCGTCVAPQTCGGGGVAFQCGLIQ
jgi:hypothetical protein